MALYIKVPRRELLLGFKLHTEYIKYICFWFLYICFCFLSGDWIQLYQKISRRLKLPSEFVCLRIGFELVAGKKKPPPFERDSEISGYDTR